MRKFALNQNCFCLEKQCSIWVLNKGENNVHKIPRCSPLQISVHQKCKLEYHKDVNGLARLIVIMFTLMYYKSWPCHKIFSWVLQLGLSIVFFYYIENRATSMKLWQNLIFPKNLVITSALCVVTSYPKIDINMA